MHLIWRGHIWHPSGYSIASANLIRALLRKGVEVEIDVLPSLPSPFPVSAYQDLLPYIIQKNSLTATPKRFYYPLVTHTTCFFRDECKYQILYTTFEANKLTSYFKKIGNDPLVHEIWVPSTHNVEIFSTEITNKPVIHIPHGVDLTVFKPLWKKEFWTPFTFLCVAAWSRRKGLDVLCKAFTEEFSKEEPVRLILKTKIPKSPLEKAKAAGLFNDPRIFIEGRVFPPHTMNAVYNMAHAFILPTRGEGFGLPIIEAMACELPVIVTGWGGHMDYVNNNNTFLIEIEDFLPLPNWRELPAEYEQILYAEPSLKHTRELMRYVYENYSYAIKIGRNARASLGEWTWDKAVDKIINRLEQIDT